MIEITNYLYYCEKNEISIDLFRIKNVSFEQITLQDAIDASEYYFNNFKESDDNLYNLFYYGDKDVNHVYQLLENSKYRKIFFPDRVYYEIIKNKTEETLNKPSNTIDFKLDYDYLKKVAYGYFPIDTSRVYDNYSKPLNEDHIDYKYVAFDITFNESIEITDDNCADTNDIKTVNLNILNDIYSAVRFYINSEEFKKMFIKNEINYLTNIYEQYSNVLEQLKSQIYEFLYMKKMINQDFEQIDNMVQERRIIRDIILNPNMYTDEEISKHIKTFKVNH